MVRTHMIHTTDASHAGMTIEAFMKNFGYSQHLIRGIRQVPDGITIDQIHVYTTRILTGGETIKILLPLKDSSEAITPVKQDFKIVYDDEDIMVINKPAGMPVHPSQGNYGNTLANGIAYIFEQNNEPFVFRAINRLDRDTSGLLIVAKNPLSACILSDMIRDHSIHREYLAIAAGLPPESGTITAPIARKEASTIERCVDNEHGEAAVTHYKRIDYKNSYSLLRITLETGRTHQIRVHLKHIGHPLPGDFVYNPDYSVIARQALHSASLEFKHPITKEPMCFNVEMPEDMKRILDYNIIDSKNSGHN